MLSATPETLPDGTKAPAPPLSVPAIMTAGGGAGIAMWSLGIPPDVSGFFFFGRFCFGRLNLLNNLLIHYFSFHFFLYFYRPSNLVFRVRHRGPIPASWTVPESLSLRMV